VHARELEQKTLSLSKKPAAPGFFDKHTHLRARNLHDRKAQHGRLFPVKV